MECALPGNFLPLSKEIKNEFAVPPDMTAIDFGLINSTAIALFLDTPDVFPLVDDWYELSEANRIFYRQAAMVSLGIQYQVGPLSAPND